MSDQSNGAMLLVRVVWGDLTRQPADAHCVGHYQGVLPVSAERALDEAISGERGDAEPIITEHTMRRWLEGKLGDIAYFPSFHDIVRVAVVAGMGRPGTFSARRAAWLYQGLVGELARRSGFSRVASVLVGSGAGNLSVPTAVASLVDGLTAPSTRAARAVGGLRELSIVEFDRLRAERTLAALLEEHEARSTRGAVVFDVEPDIVHGEGGSVGSSSAFSLLLASAASVAAAGGAAAAPLLAPLDALGPGVSDEVGRQVSTLGQLPLAELARATQVDVLAGTGARPGMPPPEGQTPIRLSILADDGLIRVAAITERATVPERLVAVDPALIDELVARGAEVAGHDVEKLSELTARLLLPADIQQLITPGAPLVLEVDRSTARVHWELLVTPAASGQPVPLAVQAPLARQLRTTYSNVHLSAIRSTALRALVIGDPGDAAKGMALEGARREALRAVTQLREQGVEVQAFVGAPGTKVTHHGETMSPAVRLDVLAELLCGDYDIVHYCGHGEFDPDEASRAGWVFSDGLLTSRELAQLDRPPELVVSNACVSSRLGGGPAGLVDRGRAAALNASVADELLRHGVRNFVGSAWYVRDDAAERFTDRFYAGLFTESLTIGDALCQARVELFKFSGELGPSWAAYQHYGDPRDGAPEAGVA